MLHALTAPVFKSVVLGSLVLAAGAVAATQVATSAPASTAHRLVLHAIEEPRALYLTAWQQGDLVMAAHGDRLTPLVFKTRAWISDGCQWEGTETLLPISGHSYAYDYSETILARAPDAVPALKTPRKGLVTVTVEAR